MNQLVKRNKNPPESDKKQLSPEELEQQTEELKKRAENFYNERFNKVLSKPLLSTQQKSSKFLFYVFLIIVLCIILIIYMYYKYPDQFNITTIKQRFKKNKGSNLSSNNLIQQDKINSPPIVIDDKSPSSTSQESKIVISREQ